jgi:DNA-binding MarR family transcriptional regulator
MAAEDVGGTVPQGSADDVPWLGPDELAAWLALVGVAVRLPVALDRRLQAVAGLAHVEYFVLARLSSSEAGSLRMTDLAVATDSSAARVSHVVGRLEARGLVERRPSAADRRVVEAVLTRAGRDLLVATAPDHVRHVRSLVLDVVEADELAQVQSVCERILVRLATDGGCCGPTGRVTS